MQEAATDLVELAQPRHSILQRILEYWNQRRGDREFPARRDIDPVEFGYALGHVSLIEVQYAPLRFRFRLVPSAISHYLGYEMTGKYADEIREPELKAFLVARYTKVVNQRRPLAEMGDHILDGRRWRHQAIYLPLAADGTTIDMLLSCRIAEKPRQTSTLMAVSR